MLITGLIFKGIIKLIGVIYDEAEREYLDDTPYLERLDEMYSMFQNGEITPAEYEKEEGEILERLKEIRNYKKDSIDEESGKNE